MGKPTDICYCLNKQCKRYCERNLNYHDFNNQRFSVSNFSDTKNFKEEDCEYFSPICSIIEYTSIWNDFQIRQPVYLDNRLAINEFDVVKWQTYEPRLITNIETNKEEYSTRSCFSIAKIIWDEKTQKCILTKYSSYDNHKSKRLKKWLDDFMKKIEKERRN